MYIIVHITVHIIVTSSCTSFAKPNRHIKFTLALTLQKEIKVAKYAKIFEYSCYALIFVLTYNTHLLTISDPAIDSTRKSSYWKSITFPASTYIQLIPGWFAKELEVYEGLGGSLGVMAICYTASKSVKKIVSNFS